MNAYDMMTGMEGATALQIDNPIQTAQSRSRRDPAQNEARALHSSHMERFFRNNLLKKRYLCWYRTCVFAHNAWGTNPVLAEPIRLVWLQHTQHPTQHVLYSSSWSNSLAHDGLLYIGIVRKERLFLRNTTLEHGESLVERPGNLSKKYKDKSDKQEMFQL